MRTINSFREIEIKNTGMSVPTSLSPKKVLYATEQSEGLMDFISSQHPLINAWLVFSLVSIGVLSVVLYII